MSSSAVLNRRSALTLGGVATFTCLTSPAYAAPTSIATQAVPSRSFAEWYELLDFVPENASVSDILKIFPELPGTGANRDFQNFARLQGGNQVGRTLVASYLTDRTQVKPGANTQVAPLVIIAHIGRIVIQAAARAAVATYNLLRHIVRLGWYFGKRGYAAFNEFLKRHPFIAAIIGGVSANEVYNWLRANMP